MARPRKTTTNNETSNKESNNMSTVEFLTELTDEQITEAQSKTRARGVYDEGLAAFLSSGLRGAAIQPDTGPFSGKTAANIKSGLDNAKKRPTAPEGSGDVKVVVHVDDDKNETVRIFRTNSASAA